jgi:hypothetical protein
MSANYPTKIVLAFRSGGVCAFPKCGQHLTYEAKAGPDTYVGEAAHIRGEKPNAARYDATMTDEERNDVNNLIYMCATHHTLIDKVENDWPITTLYALKASHEAQVRQAMQDAFADVAFPELERSISWVTSQAPATGGTFHVIPPDEKIAKNGLSTPSAGSGCAHHWASIVAAIVLEIVIRGRGQTRQRSHEVRCPSILRGSRGGAPRRHSNQRLFPSSSAALMYCAGTTSVSAHPKWINSIGPNLRERSAPRGRDHCGIAECQVGCRQFKPGGATVAARNTASLIAKSCRS